MIHYLIISYVIFPFLLIIASWTRYRVKKGKWISPAITFVSLIKTIDYNMLIVFLLSPISVLMQVAMICQDLYELHKQSIKK